MSAFALQKSFFIFLGDGHYKLCVMSVPFNMKLYLNLLSTAFNQIKNVIYHFEANRALDLKKFVPFYSEVL